MKLYPVIWCGLFVLLLINCGFSSKLSAMQFSVSESAAVIDSSSASKVLIENVAFNGGMRTLRIYLPPTYIANPTKKYPVLYMFDGQNLFGASLPEWHVDETLDQYVNDKMTDGIIVVGIENARNRKKRYEEYTHWDWTHPELGYIKARGDETAAWLVNTVIPFVNKKYRTLTDRANTGLAGSSMGGYMTIYTGLTYPQVFGKLASFSTVALDSPMQGWNLRAYVEAAKNDPAKKEFISSTNVYLDIGDQEQLGYTTSSKLVEGNQQMCDAFKRAGFAPRCETIIGGVHDETSWSKRFGPVFTLLFVKHSD